MSGADEGVKRIHAKLAARVQQRAFQGREIAVRLHETAPRGGTNLNQFDEPRSAPGEPPAMETGALRQAMLDGLTFNDADLTAAFVANLVILEYGTIHMEARPMGHLTVDELKQEVQGGS